jgi:hypothetical protein
MSRYLKISLFLLNLILIPSCTTATKFQKEGETFFLFEEKNTIDLSGSEDIYQGDSYSEREINKNKDSQSHSQIYPIIHHDPIYITENGLTGYWRVIAPINIAIHIGLSSGIKIAYDTESQNRDICFLKQNNLRITAQCILNESAQASGSLDALKVHLTWWKGPATLIYTGDWDLDRTISGSFTGGLAKLPLTGSIPASLSKLYPSSQISDKRETYVILSQILNNPFQNPLLEDFSKGLDKDWLAKNSDNPIISFIGPIDIHWQEKQPYLIEDVYQIQSGENVSLCRLALTETSKIRDLFCKTLTNYLD